MTFTVYDTVRERARRLLADTAEPLTVAAIAEQLDTTRAQTRRALKQLEREGAVVRQSGRRPRGSWAPDTWTSR